MRALIIICTILFSLSLLGQNNSKVDQIELIKDIQKWSKNGNKMTLSFWIPLSYWRIALEDNVDIPKETINIIESTFEDYFFLCAADIEISGNGNIDYLNKADLLETLSIEDDKGNTYLPLSTNKISLETLNLAKSLTPMFAKMFGQMGKGMHFFFFKVKDENNRNLIDENKNGSFTVKHSNKKFNWTLPLPSLMPNKYCPIDNDKMKGNWIFCPLHGVKLEE